MDYCNLIPKLIINNKKLVSTNAATEISDLIQLCEQYDNKGADELLIFENSTNDLEHDTNIGTIKEIVAATDIPILLGGNIKRLEDVKKYLYAGAKMAVLDAGKESNLKMIKEASERFGGDKIAIYDNDISKQNFQNKIKDYEAQNVALIITQDSFIDNGLLNEVKGSKIKVLVLSDKMNHKEVAEKCSNPLIYGCSSEELFNEYKCEFMSAKKELRALLMNVNMFESTMKFSEFKLNSEGHIPVVVQDYKTNEVLMLAYMNEEAFNKTIETGTMTYYSRSRDELWVKGLTSGHYQYVKSLTLDCDNDTLLAKVKQIGAACHTGNKTCFFNTLVKKEYDETNPLMVFEDVFNVIKDRKIHPKEGSYTNYLFDKGIDKILKKVGEEATEIVIAAKNPDPEEIKYEISDFLYHVMVLMAQRNVTWEDITKELARR